MGFPFERPRADDPYRARNGYSVELFLSQRPERALMERQHSLIALCTALFSWALALVALLFGASPGWIFQLLMFALLIALAEWVYSR
jgi:hypothetical protein